MPLAERIGSLTEAAGLQAPPSDPGRADRKLRQWRGQPPFGDGDRFARRLARDGLDEHRLRVVLGEPIEAVGARLPQVPTWIEGLERALGAEAVDEEAPPSPAPDAVVESLIRPARLRLRGELTGLTRTRATAPFDAGAVERLAVAGLRSSLVALLGRATVLELHVARLQHRLRGDTPEERFRAYFGDLSKPAAARAFLQEYPVAARQAWRRIEYWLGATVELLQRMCDDWPMIESTFSPGASPGPVVGLRMDAGDTHRRGRAVAIVSFAGGLTVAYKPRSLAVERHYQQLLAWIDARGSGLAFRRLRVLDRGTHGWSEFVARRDCADAAQVRRFYRRQGGHLALLHALGATDLHYENLVAAGEHPVPIDLETLFHPRFGARADPRVTSVLNVGLLPVRLPFGDDAEGVDLSGLGAPDTIPQDVPRWHAAGTDGMRLVRMREDVSDTHHRPTLRGGRVAIGDHAVDVIAGFRAVYDVLVRHRSALLGDDGPIAAFARDDVRVILRPTRTYGILLHESTHPDVLRDALDRERLFDRLWGSVDAMPVLARVIPAERDDLDAGDVPIFTTRPESRDLWTSTGERLQDVLPEPGLEFTARRLRELGPADLERQVWMIHAAFAGIERDTLAHARAGHSPRRGRRVTPSGAGPAPDVLRARAAGIGERLADLAHRERGECTWTGLAAGPEGHWTLTPMGLGLYDGIPGVALFLGYLGALSGRREFAALAEEAVATVRHLLTVEAHLPENVGGFTGWGGVLYALAHLGALWRRQDLLTEAVALVERLPPLVGEDRELDVLNGSAGCILGLLALHAATGSARAIDVAHQCGERLLATAHPVDPGVAWQGGGEERPLAGLSHGASGIGLALLELWARTGDARFRTTAMEAFRFERSLYSPAAANWADRRSLPPRFIAAWCHGAPGIGLARARALELSADDALRIDLDAAVAGTLAVGIGGNHSLCHGDLGNLELLLHAGSAQLDPALSAVLADAAGCGWRCDTPPGIESPELMTGLAGIGYQLLRLARPAAVPSVLRLAPPSSPARARIR